MNVALELAIKKAGKTCDIYVHQVDDPHVIAICPAIFQVDEYDNDFYVRRT